MCDVIGDAYGYGSQAGTGAGSRCSSSGHGGGSGAGHGGDGGDGGVTGNVVYTCDGGSEYDDLCAPRAVGSGGGTCSNGQSGGVGGAAVLLIAGNLMIFDGTVTMDATGGGSGAGGGSGGSIWIDGDFMEGWGQTSVSCHFVLTSIYCTIHDLRTCTYVHVYEN